MIIYPSRIKGQEYPLRKGDIVVCITEHFNQFTCGKKYQLYDVYNETGLLPIQSDFGNKPLPSYYSPRGYYFLPLHIWRELKINEVLK